MLSPSACAGAPSAVQRVGYVGRLGTRCTAYQKWCTQCVFCRLLCLLSRPKRRYRGVIQGRFSVSHILCDSFVRRLCGVFEDLHGDT